MDYQIKGKLAFVTAGAHGIGEAIANLLAQGGVGVIVADQDEAALKEKGGAWRATFASNLATAEGMDAAISHMVGAFGRAPDILVNNLGRGSDSVRELYRRAVDPGGRYQSDGLRAHLPRVAAEDGCAGLGVGGQYRIGSGEAAGARSDGVWGLQSGVASCDQEPGERVRAEDSRERRLARTGLDATVDSPRRDRRSARRSLWSRQGRGGEAIPGGALYAARDRAAGGCRARRGVSRVTTGKVYHRGESGYWGDTARTDMTAGLQ